MPQLKLTCVACKLSLLSGTKVAANCHLIERKDAGDLSFPVSLALQIAVMQ